MSFDPRPYISGLRRRNDEEQREIAERARVAVGEAKRVADAIIQRDLDVRRVFLFGSLASGSPRHLDFDIDLALDGGNVLDALDITELSAHSIDIVDFQLLPEHVRAATLANGIVLAARE